MLTLHAILVANTKPFIFLSNHLTYNPVKSKVQELKALHQHFFIKEKQSKTNEQFEIAVILS